MRDIETIDGELRLLAPEGRLRKGAIMTEEVPKTYSLAEAAALICGEDSMKDPVLWMRRKIRAGTFSA